MTFLYPNVLYALILPALLAAAAWWLWRRRSRKWEVLVSPEYRRELVHAPATWHRVLPVILPCWRPSSPSSPWRVRWTATRR